MVSSYLFKKYQLYQVKIDINIVNICRLQIIHWVVRYKPNHLLYYIYFTNG